MKKKNIIKFKKKTQKENGLTEQNWWFVPPFCRAPTPPLCPRPPTPTPPGRPALQPRLTRRWTAATLAPPPMSLCSRRRWTRRRTWWTAAAATAAIAPRFLDGAPQRTSAAPCYLQRPSGRVALIKIVGTRAVSSSDSRSLQSTTQVRRWHLMATHHHCEAECVSHLLSPFPLCLLQTLTTVTTRSFRWALPPTVLAFKPR